MSKITPGWNDPPPVPVNYQSSASGQSSKSRLLNKRIPFDFSNSSSAANEGPRINQLPESTATAVITSTCTSTDSGAGAGAVAVAESIDDDVINVIEKLTLVADNVQDINKKQDVIKRLQLMKHMWENNEFSAVVQKQIAHFANYVASNDMKQANDIYINLTLNSVSVCSSWIIAFKYLLHHLK